MNIGEVIQTAEAEAKAFLNFITPIYVPHRKRRHPDQIATALYLSVGHDYFLITAAHVLDENPESTLYCTGDTNLEEIRGPSVRTALPDRGRKEDKLDVGVVKLDKTVATQIGLHRFSPISAANVNDCGDGLFYVALGYPATKNLNVDFAQRSVSRNPLSFTNRVHPSHLVESLGLNAAYHLLLDFQKEKAFTSENQKIVAPDPRGMSGGPLLRLDLRGKTAQSTVAGLLIEWEQTTSVKGLLAVRVAVVAEAIRSMCPELDATIPKTANLEIKIVHQ